MAFSVCPILCSNKNELLSVPFLTKWTLYQLPHILPITIHCVLMQFISMTEKRPISCSTIFIQFGRKRRKLLGQTLKMLGEGCYCCSKTFLLVQQTYLSLARIWQIDSCSRNFGVDQRTKAFKNKILYWFYALIGETFRKIAQCINI